MTSLWRHFQWKTVLLLKIKAQGSNFKFQIHLINCIGRLYIVYDFYVNFTASRCLNGPLDLQFGPKNDENQYFCLKWRLKAQILISKWFWSTLLVECTSLMTFILISSDPGASMHLWTFISGPKITKISTFA